MIEDERESSRLSRRNKDEQKLLRNGCRTLLLEETLANVPEWEGGQYDQGLKYGQSNQNGDKRGAQCEMKPEKQIGARLCRAL